MILLKIYQSTLNDCREFLKIIMQEKCNISWQAYSDHLPRLLREMMTTEAFTDVTLICDDHGNKKIKAHRNILAACSPVFKNIFENSEANHPIVFLKGIKYSEMNSILHFIYLGETTFQQDRLNEFLNASKSLEIPELGDVQEYDQDVKQEPKTNLTLGTQDDQQLDDTNTMDDEHEDPLLELGKNFQENKQGLSFQCDECNKVYYNSSRLKRHKQAVHEGIKYHCQVCNTGFTQQGNLNRHLSKGRCSKA